MAAFWSVKPIDSHFRVLKRHQVMANTAFLLLYLIGRALQSMFFGPLRPVEIEVC